MGALDARVAIVTGGARGIGAATARLFAAEGATVVVADAEGKALAAELGPPSRYAHLDVGDGDGWQAVVTRTEREAGPVSVLVDNAGIVEWGTIEEQPPSPSAGSSTSTSRAPGWACGRRRPPCAGPGEG